MDYEVFYDALQAIEKGIKDNMTRQKSTCKSISKNAAKGDLKSLSKDIEHMEALASDQADRLRSLREHTESFDAGAYMQQGDFARQMLACCESMDVDIRGVYPAYEIFPYKVKIDGDNQDIYIDRKKMPCVRPQHFVATIKQNREKLMRASFNAETFLNEIVEAYDKLLKIKRKDEERQIPNRDLSLKELHRCLVPMQRFRKEYDMQGFAFDLARLFASDVKLTADGRKYSTGSARNHSQNIRILDKNGTETWVGTIRFYDNENSGAENA